MTPKKLKAVGQKKLSAREKILEHFLSHMGQKVHWQELSKVTGITEWARRVRELRNEFGYQIYSHNDRADLKPGEYLMETDKRIPSMPRNISKETRSIVLERNGYTCQMCGLGASDPDPYNPGRKVRLTLGHMLDKSKGGDDSPQNLRAVCSTCNEGLQNIAPAKPDYVSTIIHVRRSSNEVQLQILKWLQEKFKNTKL